MNDSKHERQGETAPFFIRPAEPKDYEDILRLNEELVHFLSPMDRDRLAHLDQQSELHLVVAEGDKVLAFCLTFREGADYDSVNYQWFAKHYPSFLYVDRVVVDVNVQASGLGKLLYEEVFRHARATGVPIVTAEIDIEPPNPVSLKFHEKFGFHEVGRQEVAGGKKIVSLQVAEL